MKKYFVLLNKEFCRVAGKREIMLLIAVLPLAQIIFWGFALTSEMKQPVVVIYDYAGDDASQAMIRKLKAKAQFETREQLLDHKQIETAVKTGNVKSAPESQGAVRFVPGVMLFVLILICTATTTMTTARNKQKKMPELPPVASFSHSFIVLAKAIPYFVLPVVNLVLVLVLSVIFLNMQIKGSLTLLLAESILLITVVLSLSTFFSNIARSRKEAMLLSIISILIPAMLFSGVIFPVERMPAPLQVLSNFTPFKWYYIIVKTSFVKGLGFSAIWRETLNLGLTCILVSLSFMKPNSFA